MKKRNLSKVFLFLAVLAVASMSAGAFADDPTNAVSITSATGYYTNTGTAVLTALFAVMLGFVGLRWLGKLGGRK